MSRRNDCKKSRNTCQEAEDEDHISKLPVTIIRHILSCLPTTDAVRTSVLSKGWEFKWTSIYNIYIQDGEKFSKQKRKKSSFVNFVDRIFSLSRELKSVRLVCGEKYDSSRLSGWISSVLKCDVDHFELISSHQKGVVLPRRLLNKSSLRILKLVLSCTFKVPLDNYYLNLKHLHLEQVEILSMVSSSDPLVLTVPVLETLELKNCTWSNANLVEIHSPSLTKFMCRTAPGAKVNPFAIKICGARIKEFESSGGFPENIMLHESVVLDATFLNDPFQKEYENDEETSDLKRCLQVRKLLSKFSCVTGLKLSTPICEAMALSKQELALPHYDRLQRLVLYVTGDTKLLFELLHIANSLKFLEIHGNHEELDCDEVYLVPCCVKYCLEEIKFSYVGKESLLHLAKFFLKNAVELNKVSLGYISQYVQIVNQLLDFPRASACLAIVS